MIKSGLSLSPAAAGIIGAIACTAIFALTIGLTYPLLSFILKEAGHSEAAIGFSAAMTPLGILVASPFYPKVIKRVGPWQVAAICLALSGVLILLMGQWQTYAALLVLRFLLGVIDVGVYIVSETWINQLARPETRGRIIGVYAMALSTGFGIGPLVLALTGTGSTVPFFLGALFCLLAMGVVIAIRKATPDMREEEAASPWSFLNLAPTLLLAIALYAFWESAALSLFPVFGLDYGLEEKFISIALSVAILGNTVLQVPIGWAADKTSRRGVMVACALISALGSLLLPLVVSAPTLFFPTLFVWGAVSGGIYTMAMTELGDRFSGSQLVAGNAAFALAFGLGGIIGGPVTGLAMNSLGTNAYSGTLAAVFALLAAVAWARRRTSR